MLTASARQRWAHKQRSETTAACQRGQKLENRRALMKDWAEYLSGRM